MGKLFDTSSSELKEKIFVIDSFTEFEELALQIFHYQSKENKVYKKYIERLKVNAEEIATLNEIPFIPVEFSKYFEVITGNEKPKIIFTSSGTTSAEQSRHYVSETSLYEESFRKCFEIFYGNIKAHCILALLPSYLEREGSSLIYMVKDLIEQSKNNKSGFYLYNHDDLYKTLLELKQKQNELSSKSLSMGEGFGVRPLLLGVTYALLDFTEKYKINFPELIVMETGGMKGKRKELLREELHKLLCEGFGVSSIHSEYGMTEMLSQAYSKGNGIFHSPPWMKVLIRDTNDPAKILGENQTGGINIIDLANINSCCFIATQDLGKVYKDDSPPKDGLDKASFEVVGRFDNSDNRGCNLLLS